jgi:hypothetical protein
VIWPTVIGLAGAARSGKDTAAEWFIEQNYKRYSFATPLKAGLRVMLGLEFDHTDGDLKECALEPFGVSPRRMMQTIGTEWGRDLIHSDIWLLRAEQITEEWRANDPDLKGVIISDVRFENESAWVREQGGLVVHLTRPGIDAVEAHASESRISVHPDDHQALNDGSIDELHTRLANITRLFSNGPRKQSHLYR